MSTAARLASLMTGAALAVAACTSSESSAPDTSPIPAAVDTTSVTAPTSEPTNSDDTTSTRPSTSTTSTTVGSPAVGTVELFIGGDASIGWLPLGSWKTDRWESPAADAVPSIAPGTAMTVANLAGGTSGTAGATTDACHDGRDGPTIDVSLPPPDPPGFGYGNIALPTPDWPISPRPVTVTPTSPASYQDIGESIFAGLPVDAARGSVEQVVVGDLDGDGDDEAIVSFEFVQPSIVGAPGDLAAVFIVDTESGDSATISRSHVPSPLPPDTMPLTERFRVVAVADVNGDGRMEVAIHSWYYEGASLGLFEYDGTTLIPALGAGCGS